MPAFGFVQTQRLSMSSKFDRAGSSSSPMCRQSMQM